MAVIGSQHQRNRPESRSHHEALLPFLSSLLCAAHRRHVHWADDGDLQQGLAVQSRFVVLLADTDASPTEDLSIMGLKSVTFKTRDQIIREGAKPDQPKEQKDVELNVMAVAQDGPVLLHVEPRRVGGR